MAYRNPAFLVTHYAAELVTDPTTAILGRVTATLGNDSKRALIDKRAGEEAQWTATGTDSGFSIDLGSTPAETFNRFFIPAGHGLDGEDWNLYSDDNSGFTSATLRASVTISASDTSAVDVAFSSAGTERYWAFQSPTSSTESFSLHEFWMGVYEQLGNDIRIGVRFGDSVQHDFAEMEFAGNDWSVEVSPARRVFELEVGWLDPAGADYDLLDRVIRNGREPFLYWPPDDEAGGPYIVKLESGSRRRQDHNAPQVNVTYSVSLRMVEQVG